MCRDLHVMIEYACTHRYLKEKQKLDCNSAGCVFSRDNGDQGKHICTSACSHAKINRVDLVNEKSTYTCISCGAYDTGTPSKSPSGPVDVSRTPPKSR